MTGKLTKINSPDQINANHNRNFLVWARQFSCVLWHIITINVKNEVY